MKKIIAMILCLTMLGCSITAFPIMADGEEQPTGTPISTVDEFIAMDPNGSYYLTKDIDFSGKTYTRNVYTQAFGGVLDGNGHSLLGITVSATNSDAGIFATSFSGTLKNLTIGSENAPASVTSTGSGYSVAAVAGTMAGKTATFENVTIYANVKGDGKTSGFTSYIYPNGKVTVKNCAVYGDITGNPAAGFFALSNDGSSDVEIRDSVNYANVSAGNLSAGGFYTVSASGGGGRYTNLVITGCVNFGTISATDWRVGGIVGEFNEERTSLLKIDYCYNMGNVTMKGSGGYAGGIVGGLSFHADTTGTRSVSNVYNAGLVRNLENAQRAYALCSADKATKSVSLTNGAYMMATATNDDTPCNNTTATNVKKVSEISELLDTVRAYPASDEGNCFVPDVGNTNGGYPILQREATAHVNITTYECGRKICNDCGATLTSSEEENHSYTEAVTKPNGYVDGYIVATCKHCGASEIRKGEASTYQVVPTDGVYLFDSADDFKWYAANLDAGLLTGKESIALVKDLDLSGASITPIGTKTSPFRGSFDGGYHTLTKLTVTTDDVAGLFGYVGLGASFTNIAFDTPTIQAKASAGVLFGEAVNNAVVKVENVVTINAKVTSTEGAAGSLIGSTAKASDVVISAAVSNGATIKGDMAAGFIGKGDNTTIESSFVNATLTANNKQTGSLAYHDGRFSAKNCAYVRNAMASVNNGDLTKADDFANGKIAYLMNSYENNFIFGVKDGAITFADNAVRMVRLGATKIYTDKILDPKGAMAVYATETEGGVTLAIVIDPASKIRLYDQTITVKDGDKSETIAFASLTHTRYLAVGDNCYTIENGMVLYTVTLAGVSANATYTIGTAVNGTAQILR